MFFSRFYFLVSGNILSDWHCVYSCLVLWFCSIYLHGSTCDGSIRSKGNSVFPNCSGETKSSLPQELVMPVPLYHKDPFSLLLAEGTNVYLWCISAYQSISLLWIPPVSQVLVTHYKVHCSILALPTSSLTLKTLQIRSFPSPTVYFS